MPRYATSNQPTVLKVMILDWGLFKFQATGRPSDYFLFNRGVWHLWFLDMEPASYHLSGAWNFEVTPRFLENFCTPELNRYRIINIKPVYRFLRLRWEKLQHCTCNFAMSCLPSWDFTYRFLRNLVLGFLKVCHIPIFVEIGNSIEHFTCRSSCVLPGGRLHQLV